LAREPGSIAAHRALGAFYLATNRSNEAEPHFQAIANTTKTTDALMGLADYYLAVRRFADAQKVLKDLASKDATYAVATTRLAAIDAAQGSRAQALATLHDVLTKYPKDATAGLLNARLLLADGKRDAA